MKQVLIDFMHSCTTSWT